MKVVGKISLGLTAALVVQIASGVPNAAPNGAFNALAARRAAMARPVRPLKIAPAPAPDDSGASVADPNAFALPSDNPFGTIVARNIFGLVPIPPPAPPPPPPVDPPPKITANGIMNVFGGELEALFKVSTPAKDKEPAKDQSYMLSQGQRQDDIEVVKIDAVNSTITFNNHGITQEIPLVASGKAGSGGGPGVGTPPPAGFNPGGPGRFPHPMPGSGFTGVGGPGGPGGPGGAPGTAQNNTATPGSGNPQIYQPEQTDLTPEQSAVLIEAQRALMLQQQQNGQKPDVNPNLFPTTKYTPPADPTPERP